ncbi:MAG: hypothetical protein JW748_13285 [Anaerolineales bacterium]|nr:hypothetical protein [Anaerolineales bacterium]
MNRNSFARLLVPLAVMAVGSACILEAASGPTPTPQVIVIAGDGQTGSPDSAAASPTLETFLGLTPTWTLTAQPASTGTAAPVTLTAGQDLSCVAGPHWILFDWVARVGEGETVPLLAKAAPEWPDYFFARTAGGEECWIFGGSSTIRGDAAGLPVRDAPPLPAITFTIENRTHLPVSTLRIRLQAETVWGTNLLAGHTIGAGETYGVPLTAGFYDVRIMDSRSGILHEVHDAPIGPEPSSRVIVLDGRYSVIIRNETANPMCRGEVVNLDYSFRFEFTIPGDGRISPGETVTLEGPAGIFVMRFYECGSGELMYVESSAYIGPATATYVAH